jgi:hypothetical protein
VDNLSCMKYVSYISFLEYNQSPSSSTHWRSYKLNALGNFSKQCTVHIAMFQ